MKKYLVVSIVILVLLSNVVLSQTAPFHKGVNLTGWLQSSTAQGINFRQYSKQDFENIKSLGADVVRLPINLNEMTSGSPNYIVDPLLFRLLDSVVTWSEELGIYVILDNHTFDPAVNTSTSISSVLVKVWPQVAQRYSSRSKYVMYEILNEPHGISASLWGTAQTNVINAIRQVDETHTIVVGGVEWNSYNTLKNLPVFADTNLIYTFHFYDPFLFTHQGATWVDPKLDSLANVPFPFDSTNMPVLNNKYKGTWVETSYNNYKQEGTVSKIRSLLDVAVAFQKSRHVPVYCGELGVFQPNSNETDRVRWYDSVISILDSINISWTMWDYHGGFGLFNENSAGLFSSDVNIPLVTAIGFEEPVQIPIVTRPDSVGFILYDDFIGQGITTWISGDSVDFYSTYKPNNETYCLNWTNPLQYENIPFSFALKKDLSKLKSEQYSVDLMIRTEVKKSFDIRFIDTKDSVEDHPWRSSVTIGSNILVADGKWHHLNIPLNSFKETGGWDGQWYLPEGKFDWSRIDRFEIVAENSDLTGSIFFDNIHVTNKDTAKVYEQMIDSTTSVAVEYDKKIEIIQAVGSKVARVINPEGKSVILSITDMSGRQLKRMSISHSNVVLLDDFTPSIYIAKLIEEGRIVCVKKLVVL